MEDPSARPVLSDADLDALLLTVPVPARADDYWREFPARIRAGLEPAFRSSPHLLPRGFPRLETPPICHGYVKEGP